MNKYKLSMVRFKKEYCFEFTKVIIMVAQKMTKQKINLNLSYVPNAFSRLVFILLIMSILIISTGCVKSSESVQPVTVPEKPVEEIVLPQEQSAQQPSEPVQILPKTEEPKTTEPATQPQTTKPANIIEPVKITQDNAKLLTDSQFGYYGPAFSPDGKYLLLSSTKAGNGNNLNLYRMDIASLFLHSILITKNYDNENTFGNAWNLETDRLTFSSDRNGNDDIFIIKYTGTNLVRVTTDPAKEQKPSINLAGDVIAYQSDKDGNWEIYKVNVYSKKFTRLTNNSVDDEKPNWSPLGDKIVFQSKRNENYDIFTIDADGNNLKQVTNTPSEDTDPSFSQNGKYIVYTSNFGGLSKSNIYIVPVDGGTSTRVTYSNANDKAPSMSPDGLKIAFESDRNNAPDIWMIDNPIK